MNLLDRFDSTGRAIIAATANEYEVTTDQLLAPWPRSAVPDAARCAAINRLALEKIDGRDRYTIAQLGALFGVSRGTINRSRARAEDYVARR